MTGILAARDVPAKSKAFDLLFAGALTMFFGLISLTQEHFGGILGLMMLVPLIWRRTHPEVVFFGVSAVAVLQWLIGTPLQGGNVGLLVALYAISVYGEVRYSRIALAVGGMGVLMATSRYNTSNDWRQQATMMVSLGALVFGVWAFGERRRTRGMYVQQLEERAAQLERDRDREAKLAVSNERTRIAREIHDVVAHGLSIMIVQADGGLYAADASPEQAKKALATIGDTGRASLTEMRKMLGLLKQDAQPNEVDPNQPRPQPGVSSLPELIDNVRQTGLSVDYQVTGTPRDLPALLGLTAYRIVQEGLTNTLKHAGPGARTSVRLDFGREMLTVVVTDDGRGAGLAPGSDPGHGLIGMQQRASISGGTVNAGPKTGGGYEVVATLPYNLPAGGDQ
ncbi:signal transduction histidine kinase [Kribbella voronezhensis]|uniref:histidine kinase n=1 Tax=Kribbella voronezhensis TaxID=2512212 RepID=A0A4R7TGJ4_9ACTN|nr:sensor histidine kinase [Kribbella voronezhensis]TDU91334.1 signal transduction histidine kinase [Kribbella voronezhensis]